MKQTVNLSDFRDAFRQCDRQDQFSYEALELIFDYYEEMESGMDEEIELDVVGICCDLSESTFEDVASDYDINVDGMDEDEIEQAVTDYISEQTSIIGKTSSTIIYAQF